ncbi:MAG: OmpH family outer membrane protein [Bacteroidales bacterium]|nr:OmpH family outer membrane protein [Bacteroidales bacterium]
MEEQNNPLERPIEEIKKKKNFSCPFIFNGQMLYNILSALAIVVLFILLFTKGKKQNNTLQTAEIAPTSILYLNVDTLMENYDLVDSLENHLNVVKDSLQKVLATRQNQLQSKILDYQQKIQSGKITTKDEASRIERNLAMEEQELLKMNEMFTTQIAQLQKDLNDQILDSIYSVIKKFPHKYKASIIFGYTKGGGIIYIDPTLDITQQIVKDLNQEFNKK